MRPVLQHALLTDPLAPAVQRTWIVRNFDAWYETFDVQPPTIYPPEEDRVKGW